VTGAVACLTGIDGIGVIIHGSSGCYFYPATILHREIHCTFLVEEDIIFGAGERLRELISSLAGRYRIIAVVHTCTPAITGEEAEYRPEDPASITIDMPGFMGNYEDGFKSACRSLPVELDPLTERVTVDGLSPLDPFYAGNCLEATRLIQQGGIASPVLLSACPSESLSRLPPVSISSNPDLSSGFGSDIGTFLGISETVRVSCVLQDEFSGFSAEPIIRDAEKAEDEIARACEKYLHRYDPPAVAVFGGTAYACFAAHLLESALDASITCIGSRQPSPPAGSRAIGAPSTEQVKELIDRDPPDLILGSTFERTLSPSAAFVPLTFPIRGMVRLKARPIIGIQGTLGLVEDVLNACMDRNTGSDTEIPSEYRRRLVRPP
jgi:nitrogenase molybdenum-iron protein alpha/beta subunit